MKKKELMDYRDEYIKCGKIQEESTLTGNFEKNNKTFKKLQKILKVASESDEKEMFYLSIINNISEASTLTNCCADMMKLSIKQNLARAELEEMIKSKKINGKDCHPIFISNAKLFLQEWDKGNIKPIK